MSKRSIALVGLIVFAALIRLVPHAANLTSITALAVFGGIRFRNRIVAIAVPLLALLMSDVGLQIKYSLGLSPDKGFYDGIWAIYATMAVIVLLGSLSRGTRSPWLIGATTLASSWFFFVVTDFGVWVGSNFYPHTLAGLGQCYVAAIPFFRNSLVGDVVFTTAIFAVWVFAEATIPALSETAIPSPAPVLVEQ